VQVPAKINLYLHVTGKREDGYHFLDTLIAFTDVYDEVDIKPADKFSLKISGEFSHLVENDENNIVTRAAKLMAKECGNDVNVSINLVKNIPVGAGLGGGSGDAAATLILLNEIFKAGLSQEKLTEIGLKLGADVPIFINRHAAFVAGIGDKITNTVNLPELYAVLVYPHKPLSTKKVFTSLHSSEGVLESNVYNKDISNSQAWIMKQIQNDVTGKDWISFLKQNHNDLENPAIKLLPEIKDLIVELSELEGCAFARMSGSGSTCFAIFESKQQAEISAVLLQKVHSGFWVRAVKISNYY